MLRRMQMGWIATVVAGMCLWSLPDQAAAARQEKEKPAATEAAQDASPADAADNSEQAPSEDSQQPSGDTPDADDGMADSLEATHTESDFLKPTVDGTPVQLHTFELDDQGNVWACVSPLKSLRPAQNSEQDKSAAGDEKQANSDDDAEAGRETATAENTKGYVLVYGPDKQLVRQIPLPFAPTAIDLDPSSTVYAAGEGKICKMTSEGKILRIGAIPNLEGKDIDQIKAEALEAYKKQMEELNILIADLNVKVEGLEKEKVALVAQRDSIGLNLNKTETRVVELQSTNAQLSRKVTQASLLVPANVEVSGSFDKSSGKEAATLRANKSEQLRVCFDIPENKIADAGEKTFVIRIISPQGTVLAIQDQGSGVFTDANSGEQKQFTTTATVDYSQQPKSVCAHWKQSTPFAEGSYLAEIYQDGFIVGKQNFELK